MEDLILRATKGSPLSNAEIDGNFTKLKQGVEDAQQSGSTAAGDAEASATSAAQASEAATSAATSAGNAATSAADANTRATNAETAATNSSNATKRLLYAKAAATAAKSKKVIFVDLNFLFEDMNDRAAYFYSDQLHPNNAAQSIIAQQIIAATQGKQVRKPTLDFPSIAAGASADMTVTVLNAEAGMSVNVTPPATLEAGLIVNAFVSANDTVTIRLSNITGAAIDPASGKYAVTVFLNY